MGLTLFASFSRSVLLLLLLLCLFFFFCLSTKGWEEGAGSDFFLLLHFSSFNPGAHEREEDAFPSFFVSPDNKKRRRRLAGEDEKEDSTRVVIAFHGSLGGLFLFCGFSLSPLMGRTFLAALLSISTLSLPLRTTFCPSSFLLPLLFFLLFLHYLLVAPSTSRSHQRRQVPGQLFPSLSRFSLSSFFSSESFCSLSSSE